jgi:hypothetical protein
LREQNRRADRDRDDDKDQPLDRATRQIAQEPECDVSQLDVIGHRRHQRDHGRQKC